MEEDLKQDSSSAIATPVGTAEVTSPPTSEDEAEKEKKKKKKEEEEEKHEEDAQSGASTNITKPREEGSDYAGHGELHPDFVSSIKKAFRPKRG